MMYVANCVSYHHIVTYCDRIVHSFNMKKLTLQQYNRYHQHYKLQLEACSADGSLQAYILSQPCIDQQNV